MLQYGFDVVINYGTKLHDVNDVISGFYGVNKWVVLINRCKIGVK